jgi:hypothetical protein
MKKNKNDTLQISDNLDETSKLENIANLVFPNFPN